MGAVAVNVDRDKALEAYAEVRRTDSGGDEPEETEENDGKGKQEGSDSGGVAAGSLLGGVDAPPSASASGHDQVRVAVNSPNGYGDGMGGYNSMADNSNAAGGGHGHQIGFVNGARDSNGFAFNPWPVYDPGFYRGQAVTPAEAPMASPRETGQATGGLVFPLQSYYTADENGLLSFSN
eukprot:2648908-Rhodomonas_salina.3